MVLPLFCIIVEKSIRHWIPAFAGMTIYVKWLSLVIPAKAGIQKMSFNAKTSK